MPTRWPRISLELLAGVLAWLAVGLPVAVGVAGGDAPAPPGRMTLWFVAYLGFGALFVAIASDRLSWLSYRTHRLLLAACTALATVVAVTLPAFGTGGILFILTATIAAHVLPSFLALAWIVAQAAVLTAAALAVHADPTTAWFQGVAYLSFMLFAYLTTRSGLSEAEARRDLARRNAELQATQRLLAEAHRAGERLRIARDLHDVLGHHLTGLILQLDVARRQTEGPAREAVERAHGVAKALMGDVRESVRTLRDDDAVDLSRALTALVDGVPSPAVHLNLPERLALSDARKAQTLLRCVQEVVTNAMKHADAVHLWIDLRQSDEGVTLEARDDGRGAPAGRLDASPAAPRSAGRGTDEAVGGSGLGLAGMRARLQEVGGSLDVRTGPGEGFRLTAFVPADST